MSEREKSFEELLDQSEVKDWLFRAERDMFPKMKASALSLVICDGKPDAKLALEIGAAILFDKPLIIVVPKGRTVPQRLGRIATEVIEDFQSPEGQAKLQAAITRVVGKRHLEQGVR